MTDNGGPAEQAAGFVAGLRGMGWPGVVSLALLVGGLLVAPRLGVDIKEAGVIVAGIIGAGGLHYGRQAAKQTNGQLDERIESGVRRVLADELPAQLDDAVQRGIASALDGQPPAEPRTEYERDNVRAGLPPGYRQG